MKIYIAMVHDRHTTYSAEGDNAACDLAVKIAHWIRDNPETVLAAYREAQL